MTSHRLFLALPLAALLAATATAQQAGYQSADETRVAMDRALVERQAATARAKKLEAEATQAS